MTVKTIQEFQGENRWLSNFWYCRCFLFGYEFDSTENAYQFSKLEINDRSKYYETFSNMTPSESKRFIKKVGKPHANREYSISIMSNLLYQKFHPHINPELNKKLIATGDALLIEGNWWNDKYWGVCLKTNEGENNLGKLLTHVRNYYANK